MWTSWQKTEGLWRNSYTKKNCRAFNKYLRIKFVLCLVKIAKLRWSSINIYTIFVVCVIHRHKTNSGIEMTFNCYLIALYACVWIWNKYFSIQHKNELESRFRFKRGSKIMQFSLQPNNTTKKNLRLTEKFLIYSIFQNSKNRAKF